MNGNEQNFPTITDTDDPNMINSSIPEQTSFHPGFIPPPQYQSDFASFPGLSMKPPPPPSSTTLPLWYQQQHSLLPQQYNIQPQPYQTPGLMGHPHPVPPPYFLGQSPFLPPQAMYNHHYQNPTYGIMISQNEINRMEEDAAKDPNATQKPEDLPTIEHNMLPAQKPQDTLPESSGSLTSNNCQDPELSDLNSDEDTKKMTQRRDRKNSLSRARAATLRETILRIKVKGNDERSSEELALVDAFEERRRRKNERSRQRANEKKREILRILAIPESNRTMEDREKIDREMKEKNKKNESNRVRRKRIKLKRSENIDSKSKSITSTSKPSSSSSSSSLSPPASQGSLQKRKDLSYKTGGDYLAPEKITSPENATTNQLQYSGNEVVQHPTVPFVTHSPYYFMPHMQHESCHEEVVVQYLQDPCEKPTNLSSLPETTTTVIKPTTEEKVSENSADTNTSIQTTQPPDNVKQSQQRIQDLVGKSKMSELNGEINITVTSTTYPSDDIVEPQQHIQDLSEKADDSTSSQENQTDHQINDTVQKLLQDSGQDLDSLSSFLETVSTTPKTTTTTKEKISETNFEINTAAVTTPLLDNVHPNIMRARKAANFKSEVKASNQLPPGWIVHIHQRKKKESSNKVYDLYWYTNTGKKLRSHTEIVKFLSHLKDCGGDEDVAWKKLKNKVEPRSTVNILHEGRERYIPDTLQKSGGRPTLKRAKSTRSVC